jgi:hypothetical protein
MGGWIGAAAIAAATVVIWRLVASRIRASGRGRAGATIAPAPPAPVSR